MTRTDLTEKYQRAAQTICKQGMIPFPVSPTAVEIVQTVIGADEDELDLIWAFRDKPSQTLEQLAETSGFSPEKTDALASSLAAKGLVFNQPSSSGLMVYRLLPFMTVGLMEYKFMGPLTGSPAETRLAQLFKTLMDQLNDQTQANYDRLTPMFQDMPPVDRTVPNRINEAGGAINIIPLDKKLETPEEFVLPSQSVDEIIDKFDEIAVGYCFCRQRRSLLDHSCETEAPTRNCFTFGKSARHTAAQGFAEMISKDEARRIMAEAEAAGLVHKAFHPGSRVNSPETSICNCCKDCCDTLNLWREGTVPLANSTYHLAVIDRDLCTGCGTCAQRCPTEAISIDDEGLALRDEASCFGCGVCSRFCPEEAISLQEGLRKVFILPPRLRN